MAASEAKAPVEKVGLIALSRMDSYQFEIYLPNPSLYACESGIQWSYPSIDPVLRFDIEAVKGSHNPTACVLNSFLYMFEGYSPPPKHDPLRRTFIPKSAYKSSFSISADLANRREESSTMTEICSMHHGKVYPKALPVPGGKYILIFSTEFSVKDSGSAFELFDSSNYSFRKCPPLSPGSQCNADSDCLCVFCYDESTELDFVVEAYSFIGKSHFLLQMPFASFALDLQTLEWTPLYPLVLPLQDGPCGFPEPFAGRFKTFKGGRYALLPTRTYPLREDLFEAGVECMVTLNVHDVGNLLRRDARPERTWVHEFELSSMPPPYVHNMLPILNVVPMEIEEEEEEEGDVCNMCIVQQDYQDQKGGGYHRFVIDFCRTDLTILKSRRTGGMSLKIVPEDSPFAFVFFTLN